MPFVGSRLVIPLRTVANAAKRTYMTGPGSRATQNNKPSVVLFKIQIFYELQYLNFIAYIYFNNDLYIETIVGNGFKNHENTLFSYSVVGSYGCRNVRRCPIHRSSGYQNN